MKITNATVAQPTRLYVAAKPLSTVAPTVSEIGDDSISRADKPWYWEGNVQAKIVEFLKASNISVISEANTATREQGKDIEAIDADGSILWVTVKGFPVKSQNTQARHWFAGVLLDLSLYRGENAKAKLALGLPSGFATYANLVRRTIGTLRFFASDIFWVSENGNVTRESVTLDTTKD